MDKQLLTLLLLLFSLPLAAQITISGIVQDAATGETLPFAVVKIAGTSTGTVADIDGNFKLEGLTRNSTLTISYPSYLSQNVRVGDLEKFTKLIFKLQEDTKSLEETVIDAYNPALRIIQNAIDNKKANNYERRNSYSLRSYNKLIITQAPSDSSTTTYSGDTVTNVKIKEEPEEDRPLSKKEKKDSINRAKAATDTASMKLDSARAASDTLDDFELDSVLKVQHLFIHESLEDIYYRSPDNKKKIIIASKSSGLKDPRIALLSTDRAPNFYWDDITVGFTQNISPLAYRAPKKFSYSIRDTLYPNGRDTTFILSYRLSKPLDGESYTGLLYINSYNWGLERATLDYADEEGSSAQFTLVQESNFLDSSQWFPTSSAWRYFLSSGANPTFLEVNNYHSKINLDPDISRGFFDRAALEFSDDAGDKDSSFWIDARSSTLSGKDSQTYVVMDTMLGALKLDQKIWLAENIIGRQEIPIGKISIGFGQLLNYNNWEGFKPGLSLATNRKFSERLRLEVQGAYGFKDKVLKGGGGASYTVSFYPELKVGGGYKYDVFEAQGMRFSGYAPSGSSYLQLLYIDSLTYYNEANAYISSRFLKYFQPTIGYRQRTEFPTISRFANEGQAPSNHYIVREPYLALRWSHKERTIRYQGRETVIERPYPTLYIEYSQLMFQNEQASRVLMRIDGGKTIRRKLALYGSLQAGKMFGSAPSTYLLAPPTGSYKPIAHLIEDIQMPALAGINYLQMVNYFSFRDEGLASLFFNSRWLQPLYRTRRSSPYASLHYNSSIGWSAFAQSSFTPIGRSAFKEPLRAPYQEVGVSFDGMYNYGFSQIGLASFYRIGAYSSGSFQDDFSLMLSLNSFLFNGR